MIEIDTYNNIINKNEYKLYIINIIYRKYEEMEEDILIKELKSKIQTEIYKLNDIRIILDREQKIQMFNMINEIDTKVRKIIQEENIWIIDSYPQLERDILMIKSLVESKWCDYIDDIAISLRNNTHIGIRSKKYQEISDLANFFKEKLILRLLFDEKIEEPIILNNISITEPVSLITDQQLISIGDNQQLISMITNQQPLISIVDTCRFKCEFCQKQQNSLIFCSDGGCIKCEIMRKETEKNIISKAKKEAKQSLIKILVLNDRIMNDTYFFITLNVSVDDGSDEHTIPQLIKNFKKMMPPCTMPKASVFVIEYIETAILHGLIRYGVATPNRYKFSASQFMFKNEIKREIIIEGESPKNYRHKVIEKLTNRKHETLIKDITEKWNYIIKSGNPIIGNDKQNFL